MMRFECKLTYNPVPCDPFDYLRQMVVDVVCPVPDNHYDEVIGARLAIDELDIVRAAIHGQSILHVCDSDSSGWEEVYSSLFEPGSQGEWRSDFEFGESIDHLLFMYRSIFHPALRAFQGFIIDHLSTQFGSQSAFVMWKGGTDMADKELADLGFRMIADSPLLMRPNMLKCPFHDIIEEVAEKASSCELPLEATAWVEAAWEQDDRS